MRGVDGGAGAAGGLTMRQPARSGGAQLPIMPKPATRRQENRYGRFPRRHTATAAVLAAAARRLGKR